MRAVVTPHRAWIAALASRTLEVALCLGLAVFLPFVFHAIPVGGDSRWAARFLPIFYAPLLAALFYRRPVALAVALSAPWVNHLLTGHPLPAMALLLSLELAVFVQVVGALARRLGRPVWLAPVAYGAAVLAGALLLVLVPGVRPFAGVPEFLWSAVVLAWPGMVLLTLLHRVASRWAPPGAGPGGPAAA